MGQPADEEITMNKRYPSTNKIDHQCPECGGTMEDQIITHEQHDPTGVFYIVQNVPASVCRQCDAIYLEGAVFEQLDTIIKKAQPIKQVETPTSIFDFAKSKA